VVYLCSRCPLSFYLTAVSLLISMMSDKDIVQSSAAAFQQDDSPGHRVPPTIAQEVLEPSREVWPNNSSRSRETGSTEPEPAHITTTTTVTIAEEQVQPCLEASPDVTRSSEKEGSTKPEKARNIASNWKSSSLAFAAGLLPIYFLLFATMAFKNNNAVLKPGSQAEWLLAAAKYVRPPDTDL
jgi:hypothetical protein